MSKTINSFYFSHDNNASNDDKLLAIRAKFQWEGVGLFWALLESMSRNDGYIINGLIGGLSLGYTVAIEKLQNLLDFCVVIELFKKDKKGYYSERMIEQLNLRETFVECGKEGAKKRWANREANRVKIGGLMAGKERKGNKGNKRKEIKEVYGSLKNVKLLKEEYEELLKRFGNSTNEKIENLSLYLASKGDKYKSHYATILNWARKECVKKDPYSNLKKI